jgi:hypothetical protein
MAKEQTAFVVVQKSWYDDAISHLAGGYSNSTGDVHVIVGRLDNETDPHGLWLRDVPTEMRKQRDGSRVTLQRLMIPWRYVVALGIGDEAVTLRAGFTNATTVLSTPELVET